MQKVNWTNGRPTWLRWIAAGAIVAGLATGVSAPCLAVAEESYAGEQALTAMSDYVYTVSTAEETSLDTTIAGKGLGCWYKVHVPSDGYLTLTLSHDDTNNSGYFDRYWRYRILNSSEEELKCGRFDGLGTLEESSRNIGVSSGTYYFRVEPGESVRDIDFWVTLNFHASSEWEAEFNGDPTKANTIGVGETRYGNCANGDSEDWYRIDIPSASTYRIVCGNEYSDIVYSYRFRIYDEASVGGNSLGGVYTKANTLVDIESDEIALDAGVHYVRVTTDNSSLMDYHFRVERSGAGQGNLTDAGHYGGGDYDPGTMSNGLPEVGLGSGAQAGSTSTSTCTGNTGSTSSGATGTYVGGGRLERLAGSDRYQTMSSIVDRGFTRCASAVIASGANFPDAVSASSLAGVCGCPVILTMPGELSPAARNQLERLGVAHVYLMGGTASVSPAVESQILGMGIAITRVSGADRASTSVATMKLTRSINSCSDTVVIATGNNFADSLSIGPWAYVTSSPIVLTQSSGMLSEEAVSTIKMDGGIRNVVVVGGTASVREEIRNQLGPNYSYLRLSGSDRYKTSAVIAMWATSNGLSWARPAIATGANFPDALAGAALAGSYRSVLLLSNGDGSYVASTLSSNATGITSAYVLGGVSAVSGAAFSVIGSAIR